MYQSLHLLFCLWLLQASQVHIRVNQIGYFPGDHKSALIMSSEALEGNAALIDLSSGKVVFENRLIKAPGKAWGSFGHHYFFDFSAVQLKGTYQVKAGNSRSASFRIGTDMYGHHQEDLIAFMRQQRCGYNPYFDMVCHPGDGRLFYGPVSDSSYVDASGGWHDAADQLKYLITSSNATARMLLAYELMPDKFADQVNRLGQPSPNGIPDVLDEARWGLEWILRLHPESDWLIHQVADDRDHRGFKFPDKDNADYGWGQNSYRPAYFADGNPQGLGQWKSHSTGIANVAGRSAAALAMGARIWKKLGLEEDFEIRCRRAAIELYRLGREKEGCQQGNSYGSPYRYNEDSWTDDMEWAAAELYKLTARKQYLQEAVEYAYETREEGWMELDTMLHYQMYPFMNMGHFALYELVSGSVREQLAAWYRTNLEKIRERSEKNTFGIGVPFLWCSNNLVVNFITQARLYEEMTGDMQFRETRIRHRDWLFGRNPWGTSMFTGIPVQGETPQDVHLPARALLGQTPAGGLIDGPVYRTIHNSLKGLSLSEADEFSAFQNEFVVYHDDIGDYATNEPTMDGTADAIILMAWWAMSYQ